MSKNVTKFWTESPLVYDSNRLYMGILRVYTEAYFCSDFFSLRFRNFRCPVLFILALCIRSLFSSWSVVWFFFCSSKQFPLFRMHWGSSKYFHSRCTLFYYLSSFFAVFFSLVFIVNALLCKRSEFWYFFFTFWFFVFIRELRCCSV